MLVYACLLPVFGIDGSWATLMNAPKRIQYAGCVPAPRRKLLLLLVAVLALLPAGLVPPSHAQIMPPVLPGLEQ
jgi:hypothetical protein